MDIVSRVWSEQPQGYYCISTKIGDTWRDHFFTTPKAALRKAKQAMQEGDVYWCITTLARKERRKDSVLPTTYLWQDLDEANPKTMKPRPTIAWESSPGRYHGLWKLDGPYKPQEAEAVNKALAKKVGADANSWILTKVLRIPGTPNYKYKSKPRVKLLWDDGPEYTLAEILTIVGENNESKIDNNDGGADVGAPSPEEILFRRKKQIPQNVIKLLLADHAEEGRRSDVLWYLEHELVRAGLSLAEVYTLIKNSVWNKYRGRRDEDERLRTELARAFEDEFINRSTDSSPRGERGGREDGGPSTGEISLRIENDTELMSSLSNYPGWLIDKFWTRRSHGIVAGEPKSFKSTFVMDMAVSVASGKPFLGRYEVHETGPVLIVQNENAPWILKDRLAKIRAHKGLVGSVSREGDILKIKFAPQLPIYYINQQGFNLSDVTHQKLLCKVIEETKPKLVILDPLYLMFEGDVNQAKDLNGILSWLLWLKEEYELALVVVHHWRKARGETTRGGQRMLGNTVLHGWIESAWYIARNDEELEGKPQGDGDGQAAVSAPLIIEREFRGAGTYPKLDVSISMGDPGDTTYEVEVENYVPQVDEKKHKGPDFDQIANDIRNALELKGPLSKVKLSQELGLSQRVVRQVMEIMLKRQEIRGTKKGFVLWKE